MAMAEASLRWGGDGPLTPLTSRLPGFEEAVTWSGVWHKTRLVKANERLTQTNDLQHQGMAGGHRVQFQGEFILIRKIIASSSTVGNLKIGSVLEQG